MTHTIRTIGIFVLLFSFTGQLQSQKVGTSSMQFLKVMPTARATAMGEAYVSLANGADAMYWNPAGLMSMEHHEMTSTMTIWLFDTKQLAVAYGLPMGRWGSIGFQFQYIDFGSMQETRGDVADLVRPASGTPYYNPGLTGRTFNPFSYLAGLTYAQQFTDKFSAAITVKYAMESLWLDQSITIVNPTTGEIKSYKTYADVVLFDFGMLYNTGYRSIKIGVATQNFGQQVTFAEKAHPAPLAFRLGVSANMFGSEGLLFQDDLYRLTLAYDLFQPNDYKQQMHMGVEFSFAEMFAVRSGYKLDYDAESLTFGGGVHSTLSGWPVSIDYSYGRMNEFLNTVHRISLGVQFR